jgi:hypothetical protein
MLTAKEAKTQNVQRANNKKIIIEEIIKKQDKFLEYATQVAIERGLTRASANYEMGAGECKELNAIDAVAFCTALQEYLEEFGYEVLRIPNYLVTREFNGLSNYLLEYCQKKCAEFDLEFSCNTERNPRTKFK